MYPNFKTALILGGIGWLLIPLPQCPRVYELFVSGALLSSGYALLSGGPIMDWRALPVALFGALVGPLAAGSALIAQYKEATGACSAKVRRLAASLASIMLIVSAAAVLWYDRLMSAGITPQGYTAASLFAGAILNSSLLTAWALLFGAFAVMKTPFRSIVTRLTAGVIAAETALLLVLLVYSILSHGMGSATAITPARVLMGGVDVLPWVLMLIFILTTLRHAVVSRSQA